jgi:hypothetical protein
MEKLALAYMEKDESEIEKLREFIRADLRLLPTSLREVKAHEADLLEAISNRFWSTLDYDKIMSLRDTFTPVLAT